MARSKRRRKRVTKDRVRKNAKKGGGSNWFNLPKGVEEWAPDKKMRVDLDFLPYEVTKEDNPDQIEPGSVWYKRMFRVHHGVGSQNKSVVCRREIGERCPICEEHERMSGKWKDPNERQQRILRELRGQLFMAFNIKHPEKDDTVAIFAMSLGKFWSADAGLKNEIDAGDEDILSFFDTRGGRTLRCRFSEDSFAGKKFLKVTRIDFKKRKDLDEDETFDSTVDLDSMFNIMDYKAMKKLLLQQGEDEEDDEEPKRKKRKRTRKRREEPEDDDEDDDEDEDLDDDDEEDDEEDDDEDDEDEDLDDDEDEDLDDEDDDEEPPKKRRRVKAKPKSKKRRKSKKLPTCPAGGTFGEDCDEFEECADCDHWEACEEASDN